MRVIRYALPALAPAALALGLAIGCGKPTSGTSSTTTIVSNSDKTTAVASKIELNEISAAGFEEAIRGFRGKVVFVDAWFLG